MAEIRIARSELILGAPGSGKTARAEALAQAWLAQAAQHRAVYIATAQAWDEEMRERLERQRQPGSETTQRLLTQEEPLELAHAIGPNARSDTLIIADCLTLWLTARLMVAASGAASSPIAAALHACAGPMVLISNEVAGGDVFAGQDLREFLDSLGSLNQQAAAACERVTLMTAGGPLILKGSS